MKIFLKFQKDEEIQNLKFENRELKKKINELEKGNFKNFFIKK